MPSSPSSADDRRRIGIAAAIWAASILLSRVIGLVREATIGRVLGGGHEADVYLTAFVVPDFLNYLLAGGALSIVFIPIFGGYLSRGEEREGWEAFSVIANFMLLVLGGGLAVLWLAMPALVPFVAPGFSDAQLAELVSLTRIVLWAQVFHVIGGLLSAALQATDRHTLPALAPLLYTGSIVAGGWILGPSLGAYGFAWGVLVGSFLGPFGLPLIGCLRLGLRWRPILDLRHPDLHRYLIRSLPIMLGWSIVVVDDWILRREGSVLGEGAIATVQYAKTLMKVPMGVFGLATGVAAFPTLTRLLAQERRAEAYETLAMAVKRMLVLAFGAQVAVTCAGTEISTVIYGPKLPAEQHAAIGVALAVLSLALWAWAAQTVVARGFYAMGNTWLPTIVGTVMVAICYPLYPLLADQLDTVGLAIASTVAMTAYVIVLMVLLRRQFESASDGYGAFFVRIVPATALGIGAGLLLAPAVSSWPALPRGAVVAVVGAGVYFAAAAFLRIPEVRDVTGLVAGRVRSRLGR